MFVTKCWFDLHLLCEPNSLKGKRHVIKSLKEQIINKFHISAAEVGSTDLWQRSELGVAFVTKEVELAEQIYSKVVNFIDSFGEVEIIDSFHEIEKLK
jgi:uncharacterized protein YlxP (DUF503 family)